MVMHATFSRRVRGRLVVIQCFPTGIIFFLFSNWTMPNAHQHIEEH